MSSLASPPGPVKVRSLEPMLVKYLLFKFHYQADRGVKKAMGYKRKDLGPNFPILRSPGLSSS